jgi:hypothetical protein
MPIIINDFEIQVEPQANDAQNANTPPQSASAAPALQPDDVVRIQRRHRERVMRLRAD